VSWVLNPDQVKKGMKKGKSLKEAINHARLRRIRVGAAGGRSPKGTE